MWEYTVACFFNLGIACGRVVSFTSQLLYPRYSMGKKFSHYQESSARRPRSLLAYRQRCPGLNVCMWIFAYLFGSRTCVLLCLSIHGLSLIKREHFIIIIHFPKVDPLSE